MTISTYSHNNAIIAKGFKPSIIVCAIVYYLLFVLISYTITLCIGVRESVFRSLWEMLWIVLFVSWRCLSATLCYYANVTRQVRSCYICIECRRLYVKNCTPLHSKEVREEYACRMPLTLSTGRLCTCRSND